MAVQRFAPVNLGTGVAISAHPCLWVVDTTAEIPVSGMTQGDQVFDKQSNLLYVATNATTVTAAGGWGDLPVPFSVPGNLAVATSLIFWPIVTNCTFIGMTNALRLRIAPTGAAAIVDVRKNETTSMYSVKPQAAAASKTFTTGTLTGSNDLVAGDYLTFDVSQIGSTLSGTDLFGSILLRRR